MNRSQAVCSLKEVLGYSDFVFPSFTLQRTDAAHYKVRISTNIIDARLLESIALKLGYSVQEENKEIVIS